MASFFPSALKLKNNISLADPIPPRIDVETETIHTHETETIHTHEPSGSLRAGLVPGAPKCQAEI